jgi:hypothetical protein
MDPFEAVNEYLESNNHKDPKDLDRVNTIQTSIDDKTKGNDIKSINVVAAMLPDSETRRRVRYAAISGFNAALRHLPRYLQRVRYWQVSIKL